jgi:hypothetical protein
MHKLFLGNDPVKEFYTTFLFLKSIHVQEKDFAVFLFDLNCLVQMLNLSVVFCTYFRLTEITWQVWRWH